MLRDLKNIRRAFRGVLVKMLVFTQCLSLLVEQKVSSALCTRRLPL
jgi:hypothetical protein